MLKNFLENFLQISQLKKFLGTRFPGSHTFSTPDAPLRKLRGIAPSLFEMPFRRRFTEF
jgi:hypothetical protein